MFASSVEAVKLCLILKNRNVSRKRGSTSPYTSKYEGFLELTEIFQSFHCETTGDGREKIDTTTYNILLKLVQNASYLGIDEVTSSPNEEDPMFLASYYMMYKIGRLIFYFLSGM